MLYYGEGVTREEAIADCVRSIEREDPDLVYVREKITVVKDSDGRWLSSYDSSKY